MTADEFIDTLEERSLLPAQAIANLRQFVTKSLKIVTPESLARLLIKKGWLSAVQAEQLLKHEQKAAVPRDDDLELAPLDDLPPKHGTQAPQKAAAKSQGGAKETPLNVPAKPAASSAGPKPSAPNKAAAAAASTPKAKPESPEAEFGAPLAGAGPLDDLFGQSIFGQSPDALRAGTLIPVAKRRSAISKTVWIAGAGVAFLSLVIVAGLIAIVRTNGDAEWQLAEKEFAAGSNQEALNKLEVFLDRFPNHPRSGTAIVYRGMAQLLRAAAAKTDWEQPLAIARDVLPKIVEQPDFTNVRDTLGKLLPKMAAGLAKQAQDGAKGPIELRRRQAQAALDGLALAMDPRYTPDAKRPWGLLQTTEHEIAPLVRAVERQTEFEHAAGEIRSAIATENIAAAIARRDGLGEGFPELQQDANAELLDQELAQGEARCLKVDSERHKAETKPRPSPVVSTVVFAARSDMLAAAARSAHDALGPAVAVLAGGSAFWLDAADGSPLGREFIGFDDSVPLPIESSNGEDFVVVDAVHQELARVSSRLATIRWRQPLGGAMAAPPVISGGRLFAATIAGRLMMLDVETGDLLRSAQFAEPFRVSPTISADGGTVYLASERGNLFVVAIKDFHCAGATHLGYEPGSVTLAPILLGNRLAFVQGQDSDNSILRVLTLGGSGAEARTIEQISLPGHVSSAPIVDGGRLFVATDRGALAVFAAIGQGAAPLSKVAELPPTDGSPQPRFVAVEGSRIWLGGKGIAQYELAGGASPRLVWQRLIAENVIQRPTRIGGLTTVATERAGMPGVKVTALDARTGQTKWETVIGAPLAPWPLVDADGKTLRVIHSLAGEIELTSIPTAPQEISAVPLVATNAAPALSLARAISWGEGELAVVAVTNPDPAKGAESRLMFADCKDHALRQSAWSDATASMPVAMGQGVLVSDRAGQILLLNPESGESLAAPFVLPLPPDARGLRAPAVVPGKAEAVLTDGDLRIYRLGIKEQPAPYLAALAEETLAKPIDSDIAVNGDFVLAADNDGLLTAFNLADLKPAKNWPLGTKALWGPHCLGNWVLVATDRELYCFNAKPELLWKKPLPAGPPVGDALEQGNGFVLASAAGMIWRVDRPSGEEKARLDIGQPLGSGPIVFEKRTVVAGADGSLHFIQGP